MVKISNGLSVRLSNLTFICTVLILIMHLRMAGFRTTVIFPNELMFTTHLAVSCFFAISGFLMAQKSDTSGWYASLLKKRFWTLVIPYFAICSVYILPLIVYHNVLHAGDWPGVGLRFDWYTIKRVYGLTHEYHPACGPFWYIRCLIFFIILAPIPLAIIKSNKWVALGFLSMLITAVSLLQASSFGVKHSCFFYSFLSVRGLIFFTLGIVWAYYGVELEWRHRYFWGCIFLLLGWCLTRLNSYISVDSRFLCVLKINVSWIFLVMGIFCLMPAYRLPRFLTAGCFAMFAFHAAIYMALARGVKKIPMTNDFLLTTVAFFLLLLVVISCCSIAAVLRRFVPSVARVFFGNR